MPKAKNLSTNPDGYIGNCSVGNDEDVPTLVVNGETKYLHCGIPIGNICYSAQIKGNGEISIYEIDNKDSIELDTSKLKLLGKKEIDNDSYEQIEIPFEIEDYPLTEFEQKCEGYGDKVMGILIVYSPNLEIKNINMQKVRK